MNPHAKVIVNVKVTKYFGASHILLLFSYNYNYNYMF